MTITIDKAIEILTAGKDYLASGDDFVEAVKLSEEALKGIKKIRKTLEPYVTALLPGEKE